jgi:2-polyprenyl-6-methoxyphenol hydroxylase-like FAD-dependent oxidoreductase
MSTLTSTQVLIVGAGPAGLAHAIELGRRGIRCLVVERNDRVGYAPRAKTTNVRTREHLRRWGIAHRLAARAPLGIDYPSNVVFATRLNGPLLARIENAFYCNPRPDPRYAEHGQWIPQYTLEDVLREYAQSLPGVEVRFLHQLESFEQDERGVTARVRDLRDGAALEVRCDYLIGADGAGSRVRDRIGARMCGNRNLSRNYNTVVHIPGFEQAHPHGRAIMYWMVNGELPAVMGPMDSGERFYFVPTYLPAGVKIAPDDVPRQIRRATGLELPCKVLSSDEWEASQLVADRYRDRRVFLMGDACHLHPPFGGYGMNMGIGDGVDLGWKLAAVLEGWGGASLLDSYEIERRPVHEYVIEEAVANHALLGNQLRRDGIEDTGALGESVRREVGAIIAKVKPREFHSLGVLKGYCYRDSPVILARGDPPPKPRWDEYRPNGFPGCIAPHAWLPDGSSLYDHFGKGFTLMSMGASDAPRGMVEAARVANVPLSLLTVPDAAGANIQALYGARHALIRPDQHVAWRGDHIDDAASLMKRVSGNALRPAQ